MEDSSTKSLFDQVAKPGWRKVYLPMCIRRLADCCSSDGGDAEPRGPRARVRARTAPSSLMRSEVLASEPNLHLRTSGCTDEESHHQRTISAYSSFLGCTFRLPRSATALPSQSSWPWPQGSSFAEHGRGNAQHTCGTCPRPFSPTIQWISRDPQLGPVTNVP